MIHFVGKSGSGGGGGSSGGASVSFNPPSGSYVGTSLNVTITVTNATRLRWKINNGAYTTVGVNSTLVAVSLTLAGNTLSANALDATGNVLGSGSAFYQKTDGGS